LGGIYKKTLFSFLRRDLLPHKEEKVSSNLESVTVETMDEESEYFPITVTTQNRKRNVPWSKLAAGIYSLFLLWLFVGNVLYTIRVIECSVRDRLESFRCDNITTFGSSAELELAWYLTRLIHMICFVLALQRVSYFPLYLATLGKLKRLPEFWTLVVLLSLGLFRYVMLLFLSKALMDILLTLSFIISCILKLVLVGVINYCQLDFVRQRYPTFVFVLFKITLIAVLLQSINDFCLGILQLALRADDLNKLQVGNSKDFRTVFDLFRQSAELSFHYKTMNFFWQKLFDDNKNILKSNHVILEHP